MENSDIRSHFNLMADQLQFWRQKNSYYYKTVENLYRQVIPPNKSVLEIGCGIGDLLTSLRPKIGVGIDFSERVLEVAKKRYPRLHFVVGDAENLPIKGQFDYIVFSDLIGYLRDIWQAFRELHQVVGPHTKIIITSFNFIWQPIFLIAQKLGLRMPVRILNWFPRPDTKNLLELLGFQAIEDGQLMLLPRKIPFLSTLFNNYLIKVPGLKRLYLFYYIVATRQQGECTKPNHYSCSVIVPCRNEVGNIESCVEQIPQIGTHTEIMFVDGESTDGTQKKIIEMMEKYKGQKDIKLVHQISPEDSAPEASENRDMPPKMMLKLGKGDAVRKGFVRASGDILMILDADLTVSPKDLPKFYLSLVEGKARFINGTRLVYPMENEAMRPLNYLGNKGFSLIFTWLLNQRIRDTLCGTKALFKSDYLEIEKNRAYFGDFDPFGDFDLLFGTARLGLRIVEVPIRYRKRVYGEIKISRFRHGWQLLKMSYIGFKKLKLENWCRQWIKP